MGPYRKASGAVKEGPDYDLFVIGGGSGGVRAARYAAKLGVLLNFRFLHRFS